MGFRVCSLTAGELQHSRPLREREATHHCVKHLLLSDSPDHHVLCNVCQFRIGSQEQLGVATPCRSPLTLPVDSTAPVSGSHSH